MCEATFGPIWKTQNFKWPLSHFKFFTQNIVDSTPPPLPLFQLKSSPPFSCITCHYDMVTKCEEYINAKPSVPSSAILSKVNESSWFDGATTSCFFHKSFQNDAIISDAKDDNASNTVDTSPPMDVKADLCLDICKEKDLDIWKKKRGRKGQWTKQVWGENMRGWRQSIYHGNYNRNYHRNYHGN